jgi:hypothetical protein
MKRTLLLLALISLMPLHDAPAKNKGGGKKPGKKPEPIKIHASESKITSVSSDSISVGNGKTSQSYKISGSTQIRLDGRRVSANELRSGMRADVTASQLDPGSAMSIEATSGK